MKYFRYANNYNPVLVWKVYETVQKYKPLAISKYGTNCEDALDDAFFHILRHYNESLGTIESFTQSVVGKIQLGKYAKEGVGSDILLDLESDKVSIEIDEKTNPVYLVSDNDDEYSTILEDCIQHLIPSFIKDYKFFRTKNKDDRKLKYNGLFKKYSAKAVGDAINYLASRYYAEAEYLDVLSKSCHARCFDSDRYKKSIDKTLSYVDRIGDIVKCKSKGLRGKKYVYSLDIEELLSSVYTFFYSAEGIASKKIHNTVIYCSLSGQLLFSKDELFEMLENEIIGSILALRSNLKVIHYEKGMEILFSSTNESEPQVILKMFKTGIYLPLRKLTIGKIDK